MAKKKSDVLHSADVSDETVSQVGRAVVQIVKLRKSMEDQLASARSDEDRETIADELQSAAVLAISDQGLSITEYNQVIASAEEDTDLEDRVLLACQAA
jgi:hypothetical protein